MSKLINLIREHASIEEIKADLYDNRGNEDYVNIVDEDGMNALIWACALGNIEVVKLLLEANADVNLVDKYGYTALKIAERYNRTEIVKLLKNCNNYIILHGKKYKLVKEIKLVEEIENE